MQEPPQSDEIIAIVDDDPSVRKGLERVIRSMGWKAVVAKQRFAHFPRCELTALLFAMAISCWFEAPGVAVFAVAYSISFYSSVMQPNRLAGARAEIVPHPRPRPIGVALPAGLLASFLMAPLHAQAQPPQCVTTVWQTEQGLPHGSIYPMLQDLEGYVWDAGAHRTPHYTNIAPGEHSFHAIAAISYSISNDRGASVRRVLRPQSYQTVWFYTVCAAVLVALLWAVFQFRIRQLHRKFKQLQDVIETDRFQRGTMNQKLDSEGEY